MKGFFEAYEDNRNGKFITYRTGEISYEEAFANGFYYSAGWLGAGYAPQTIIYGSTPRLNYGEFVRGSAFIINIDGEELLAGWNYKGLEKKTVESGLETCVTLENPDAGVEVRVKTLLDGTDILTRWLEIKNLRKSRRRVGTLDIMAGGLQKTERPQNMLKPGDNLYRVGYMDASNWGTEGSFRWHELQGDGGHVIAGRFARDRFRQPMFVLENRATGANFICQIGYSGGWRAEIDVQRDINWEFRENALCSFRVGPDGIAPLALIEPDGIIITPKIHMGMVYGDLDDCCNRMHDHVRRSVIKHYTYWNAPVEVGLGGEMNMDIDGVLASIDYAKEYGAEYFIIDHGWQFQPESDKTPYNWIPNTLRYACGMDKIREKCHENGMKFGLWMEPERAFSREWPIMKEHPEYLGNNYTVKPGTNFEGGCENTWLSIYNDETAEAVFRMMDEVITAYRCEIFRLDHNVFSRSYKYADGVRVYGDFDYYRNFYAIMERLREKHPECIIENCASGGGRTDLGMLEHADHTWITDWQKAPRSFMITNGLTMALPPETIDRIITAQCGHLYGSFEFQAFQLFFGRITLNATTANGTTENSIQREKLTRIMDFNREVIQKGGYSNVYHHTPEFDAVEPKGTGIIERAAQNGSYDVVGVFNLADAGVFEDNIRPRGIDVSANYEVTVMSTGRKYVISGSNLANEGLRVRLAGSMTAEAFCMKRV